MFTTALEEGEIITGVTFPVPQKAAYVKFNQPASRFALTAVFVAKFADGVRVAVTGRRTTASSAGPKLKRRCRATSHPAPLPA